MERRTNMRYLYTEADSPMANDYYYEVTHTTNNEFPIVPSHTHNYYEIYMYLSGSIRLSVEDTSFEVKEGDIIIIPPFTIHQLFQTEPKQLPYIRMYMYITEPCLKSFQFNEYSLLSTIKLAAERKCYHFHIRNYEEFKTIKDCMRYVYDSKKSDYYGKEMLNRAHILHLITLINKNVSKELSPTNILHMNPLVESIISYINSNYTEDISLDSLTERFYINKSTLSKEFKDQTAQTIHSYLVMKRINMAKQEMAHGVAPSQVYLSTGFKDYSTFYRTFQRIEGVSPKNFYSLVTANSEI